jgi:hypothetical protein
MIFSYSSKTYVFPAVVKRKQMLNDCDSFGQKSGSEEKYLGFLCSFDGAANKTGCVCVYWFNVAQ